MLTAHPCDTCVHTKVCRVYSGIFAEYIESSEMFDCRLTKIKSDININMTIDFECENYLANRED